MVGHAVLWKVVCADLFGALARPDHASPLGADRACLGLAFEVEELGCTYRDWSFSLGLVDFPAQIDGEDVYLCWRSDERDVRYYHGLLEGYAGRRLIPQPHAEEVLG